MRHIRNIAVLILAAAAWAPTSVSADHGVGIGAAESHAAAPDAESAARMFGLAETPRLSRIDEPVPGWLVENDAGPVGYIGSTWEITRSIGYSGQPIEINVAVTLSAEIAGADLVRHAEPILTLGLSTEDIARFVGGFAGVDLTVAGAVDATGRSSVPDVISRATVSSGVMRDTILRTARTMALGYGLVGGAGIDRLSFREMGWRELMDAGALSKTVVSLDEARTELPEARMPPPPGGAPFLEVWAGIIDPPSIGRSLLGQHRFSEIVAAQAPGEAALFIGSRGLHSHRGTAWRRSGTFDRITVIQDDLRLVFATDDYTRIDHLATSDAPTLKERSIFRLPADGFDPTRPFRVEITASRTTAEGSVTMTIPLEYHLPAAFVGPPPDLPEPEPLWVSAWEGKQVEIAGVLIMLAVLGGILFLQDAFVRRPALWRWGRMGFLTVTLVWLGWIAGGQLSVVQVIAFVHSLLTEFHWETFLIEPVIFLLWGFVALGILFWGRGVFCGWLCPFGALQEITNEIAQRLGVPQIAVPFGLHERLWVIKYTLFVAILALSFYSMEQTLLLAEVEPFKTVMSLRFMRAWPFVLFVVVLLVAGLFIERFYCRYLCALGAGLAIPAKLKLFDWLRRRPQCGRECRLCEQKCTVGAIDPLGRISSNECILCLRCQMIYHDPATCTILKRRRGRTAPIPAAAAPQ